MKEDKLNTEDGKEFTVFYLSNKEDANKEGAILKKAFEELGGSITHKGVSGCCPVGEVGEVGEVGVDKFEAPFSDPLADEPEESCPVSGLPLVKAHHPLCIDALPVEKEQFVSKLMGKIKQWTTPPAKTAEIDDSLDSDVVDEPVGGRVYKVRGLNIIARYKKTSEIGHHIMSFHGDRFLIVDEDAMLLKASPYEVERYLSKAL